MRKRNFYRLLAAGAITLSAAGTLIGALSTASYADSTTPPPWDTFTGSPATDGATYGSNTSPVGYGSQGGLLFFNSAGQQITGGSITSAPIAAYVQGAVSLGGTKANLYLADPTASDPSGWTTVTPINSSTTFGPVAGAPSNISTTLPVFSGNGTDQSLSAFAAANPDGSNPDAGYYQVRLVTTNTANFDSADIDIDTTNNTWTLAYSYNEYGGGTSSVPSPVGSSVTLAALPASPKVQGTNVTLTATVTDADGSSPVGGTVQFKNGTSTLGSPATVASNGQATLSTTALPQGPNSLTAVFTPATGTNYSGNTSAADVYTITAPVATTTTLTSVPAGPVTTGTSVTFTATVTDSDSTVPTGTVTFEDGGTAIAGESNVALTAGTGPDQAVYTTSGLSIATHSLSAVYNPPAGYGSSTGTESFTVTPAGDSTATSLSVNPSVASADSNVTITAAVVDTAVTPNASVPAGDGSVQFYDNGTSTSGVVNGSSVAIGSPVTLGTGGVATLTYGGGPAPNFAVGAHNLVAVYSGDSPAYIGSTSPGVLFTALGAAAPAVDQQTIEASIPAGGLYISTPYTPTNPFNLGTATLNPATATFTAQAPFGTPSNPGNGVSITDTQAAGTGWVASAYTTDFTSGANSINGQNLTLTNVTPVAIAGNSLLASDVATQSVTDTQTYAAGAGGTDGLQGESDVSPSGSPDLHEFAHTTSNAPGFGIGSIYIDGLLTLTAPSSTPAGTYTATLTFTIS